ncbi:hypothetical protein KNSL1_009134 [Colletotrichum chrysophilum]|nr:hypothetical protein KNSL1_009134 [Colletotrichum chrysophilum]
MPPSKRQRVKDDSDSSDSDGSEYGVESNKGDDHNNVAPGTHMLGLSQDYVPFWTEGDAFREWYQNWKDSIIQTFNLNPRPFILEKNTTDSDIQITIHRTIQTGADQSQKELLGYIKFIKQTGTLELANFNAALDPRHLSLGGTTKRDDSKTAGTHGEGFKVAALVMTRNNRVVHIESSSGYWNFGFRGANKDKFSCQITKPATSTIKKHRDSLLSEISNGRARTNLTSYVHRDVIVRISTPKGYESIKDQQFWDWSSVAIDLHCPSPEEIIRTEHGDLLIGPPFAGRIYLKGLRVSGQGPGSATYSYGYDFAKGRINRDRERMMNQMEEARIVASIWEMAVIERPELTKEYVRLFDVARSPDVAFTDTVVSKKMAEHLWQYLLKDAPNCFFYANDPDSQLDVAHQKKASIIPRELWKMLRKFKLARTPEEHIDHKFLSSEAITIPDDLQAQVDGSADAEPVESTAGCEEWIEDQQTWSKWHAEDLPIKISQMFATRNACKCDATDNFVDTKFDSRRLNFNFEKDQYVRIKDTSGNFGTYIALVHDISPGSVRCVNTPHLIITKYSFYDQTSLLWDSKTSWDDYDKNENRELLLHCTATKTMGTFSDNEVVAINDIDLVGHMGPDFDIMHCAKHPG